jgi:hypothetical protein
MAKADFVDRKDGVFATQLQTFKNNVTPYVAGLGLSPAQVTSQAADADYMQYVVGCLQIMQDTAQQWTTWKNDIRTGTKTLASGAPVVPALSPAVPPVNAGIEARYRALVKQCKASGGYNPAIGQALGIEGADQTGPDLNLVKPAFEVKLNGTQVDVLWGWAGNAAYLDMIELQVDRGAGWQLLSYDTTPNYSDTAAQPSAPTKWKYRGIYRVGDQRVGQWSATASVIVGG